jgi:hypothetical protein
MIFFAEQPSEHPLPKNKKTGSLAGCSILLICLGFMAPEVGLEPTTLRLTADSSLQLGVAIERD